MTTGEEDQPALLPAPERVKAAVRKAKPPKEKKPVAIAELDGPTVALAAVDRLADQLVDYHAFHATRADLLRRLGRGEQARAAYDRAIELAGNAAEISYLTRRRDQLRAIE